MRNLYNVLQDLESDYKQGSIEIAEGLLFSQYKTLRETEFITNSRYLYGEKDRFGREKPYFQITNANVDVSVVATDIDRKDIQITSDNPSEYDKSFVLRRCVDNWMRDENFGDTLNEMGETRARYGGVLVKKKEYKENGEAKLKVQVVEWKNTITDPVDIAKGTVVEIHYLTPDELLEHKDDWENVEEALKIYTKKGKVQARIEVYEVHGMFPKSMLSEDAEYDPEDTEYVRQHHVFTAKSDKFVHLYWTEEEESPYKYKAWKKVSGRSLGRGVVEEGVHAQVWTNDAIIGEKEAFELGRKVLFKTNSKKIGNNALTDLDNGHIIELEEGKDINILNTISGALPEFKNLIDKWGKQYDRVTSITDALRGETPPSGQSFRLGALTTQQSGSMFDYRREEMGLFLEEIFRDWVLPHIIKKYNKMQTIASDLFSTEELIKLDEKYAIANANKEVKKRMLQGKPVSSEEYEQIKGKFRSSIASTGSKRYLDIDEEGYFKGFAGRVVINTTNEQKNKMAILESLSNIISSVSQSYNPQTGKYALLEDKTLRTIFNQILELSGANVSPFDLETDTPTQPMAQQQMMQPQGAQGQIQPMKMEQGLNLPGPQAVTNS